MIKAVDDERLLIPKQAIIMARRFRHSQRRLNDPTNLHITKETNIGIQIGIIVNNTFVRDMLELSTLLFYNFTYIVDYSTAEYLPTRTSTSNC